MEPANFDGFGADIIRHSVIFGDSRMTPPANLPHSPDHCPVGERVAVLEAEKNYTWKAMEKMEKEVSEIRDTVTRIERESHEMKKAIEDQGGEIKKLATIMEGKNGQTGAGNGGNGKAIEGLRAALGGLAGSLGYSILFGVCAGAMSPDVAKEILKFLLKALFGI